MRVKKWARMRGLVSLPSSSLGRRGRPPPPPGRKARGLSPPPRPLGVGVALGVLQGAGGGAVLEEEALHLPEALEEALAEGPHPLREVLPVLGWTILGPSSPRTRRTTGLGTPRPISTSGQTGTKSTCSFRAATTLSGMSSPE